MLAFWYLLLSLSFTHGIGDFFKRKEPAINKLQEMDQPNILGQMLQDHERRITALEADLAHLQLKQFQVADKEDVRSTSSIKRSQHSNRARPRVERYHSDISSMR